ncbi:MAG TPA: YoaK family protein [Pyrinomonadaceae bacterium]|nr:YoaK family protein [Pyrinomonadaceae bacterium]
MEQIEKHNRFEPLPVLLLVLTITTGLLDAVSFLGLGRVFTANMTGNVVFLGFALGGASGIAVTSSLIAIGAFVSGAVLGGRIGKIYAGEELRKWFLTVALIESGLLLVAGFVALGFNIETQSTVFQLYAVIVLTAAAMGLRNSTVRQINVKDITTTVLTLTLTGIGADSTLAGGANTNIARRVSSVALMLAGAALGAFLLYRSGGVSLPLFVCGASVLIVTLVHAALPASRVRREAAT